MIKINLLPPAMREAARGSAARFPARPIGISAAALAVLISVVLPLGNGLQARSAERLRAEWKEMQPQMDKLTQTQKSFQELTRQAQVLQAAKSPEARWSPRLALLSDGLVSQVWLTHLEYPQGKSLQVEGSALLGSGGDSSGQVTKFLQHLKEQPQFQQWFKDVELKSVQHRQVQNEETADFILLLTPTG